MQKTDQGGVHDVHDADVHDPHSELEEAAEVTEVVLHSKEAQRELEEVKVLCWVMTGPTNHQAKVRKGF